jgi:hypothetical protein
MYVMKAVASSIFRTMMFPHNGKIITIDQVSHYEPNPSANIDNILPLIHSNSEAYPLIEMGPRIFKDPSWVAGERRRSPQLHFPHASNLLARYVRKMDTQPTNAHLYPNYVT